MALGDKDRDAFLILQSRHTSDAMEGLALPRTVRHGFAGLGEPAGKLAPRIFSPGVEQTTLQHRRENATCTIS